MKIQQELFHRTQTYDDFLFYKTDEKSPPEKDGSLSKAVDTAILKHFPHLPEGKAFLDDFATATRDKAAFGVMALGFDKDPVTAASPAVEDLMAVLKCLSDFCGDEDYLWGRLASDLYAVVLPGKDAKQMPTAATDFRKQLAGCTRQTVTMGIAAYPVLEYTGEQILECALKALNHAAFLGPDSQAFFDAVSLNISGDRCYQRGDIDGAISEYRLALLLDPGNVNVLNSMGVCYAVMGEFDTAHSYFETAKKCDPDEVMAWYNSALVYKLQGNRKEALAHFLEAGAKPSNTFEIAFQTGKLYYETGNIKEGEAFYRKALAFSGNTSGNHRFVGDCHMALGDPDAALAAYKTAIKENPNDAYALSALGMLFHDRGENPEIAAVFCQQSVDISPQNSLFRRRLALIHLSLQMWEQALEGFKTADALDAANPKQKAPETTKADATDSSPSVA